MRKFIITAELRDMHERYFKEEITYSKLCEELNEKAEIYAQLHFFNTNMIDPTQKIVIQQSKNWSQDLDLDWYIENAVFAFTNSGYKGHRLRIVTKTKLGGMDCFEFDNDRYGVIITSESEFKNDHIDQVVVKSSNVKDMFVKFLYGYGCEEFVNPNHSILYNFMNFGNFKLVTLK
jgi:hypothetical protein